MNQMYINLALSFLTWASIGEAQTTLPKPTPSCPCGSNNQSTRIVNGEFAKPGQIPWQVGIQKQFSPTTCSLWEVYCGGVVISAKYVLTATHCVDKLTAAKVQVVAGILDLTTKYTPYTVTSILMHPVTGTYRWEHDISILTLKDSLKFSDMVYPICLPPVDLTETFAGKIMRISGWGRLVYGGDLPNQLITGEVKGLSHTDCLRNYTHGELSKDMLCAYNGTVDVCDGDSGGPLAFKARSTWFLAGIVSWGDGCTFDLKPTIYVRMTSYVKWIHQNTGNNICTRPFTP